MNNLITVQNAIATMVIAISFYFIWCGMLRWAFNFYFGFRVGSSYESRERQEIAKAILWTRGNKQSKAQALREGQREYKHHEIGLRDLMYLRWLALTARFDCWIAERLAKRFVGDTFYVAIEEVAKQAQYS